MTPARGSAGTQPLLYARALHYLGQPIEPVLAMLTNPGRPAQAMTAVVLSFLERFTEAATIRERFGDFGSPGDETAKPLLVCLLETSVLGRHSQSSKALMTRLTPLAASLDLVTGVSIGRLLGDAALLLSETDDARGFYTQALNVCVKVRFRPEIALTRLSLAELLLEHYSDERDDAIEHLDFAIAELRDMKMQPALERALRHRGLLKA